MLGKSGSGLLVDYCGASVNVHGVHNEVAHLSTPRVNAVTFITGVAATSNLPGTTVGTYG